MTLLERFDGYLTMKCWSNLLFSVTPINIECLFSLKIVLWCHLVRFLINSFVKLAFFLTCHPGACFVFDHHLKLHFQTCQHARKTNLCIYTMIFADCQEKRFIIIVWFISVLFWFSVMCYGICFYQISFFKNYIITARFARVFQKCRVS